MHRIVVRPDVGLAFCPALVVSQECEVKFTVAYLFAYPW